MVPPRASLAAAPAQQGWHHHRALGRGRATFPDGFGAPSQASCEQQHSARLCPLTACCPSTVWIGKWDQSVQAHFPCAVRCFCHCPRAAGALHGVLGSISSGVWGDQPCIPSLLPAQPRQSAQDCPHRSPGSRGAPRAYLQQGQELHVREAGGSFTSRTLPGRGLECRGCCSLVGQERSVIHSSSRPGSGHVGI